MPGPALDTLRIDRPAEADWPSILALLETANLHRIGGPEMREYPLSMCFVARLGKEIVGVCGYRIVNERSARNTMTAVAPKHRGQGVGTRLKRACIDFLAEQGVREIFTNCDHQAIIDWNLREFGFQPTGRLIPKEEDFGDSNATHWINLVARWPFRNTSIREQVATDFQRNGFCALRDRFSPFEVKSWLAESERVWNQPGLVTADSFRVQHRQRLDGNKVLERLDWVIPESDVFTALAQDPRITEPVARLIGGDIVLFKDKLIVRPPGTHGYGLHQDFPYWEASGIPADELLTVCIALDETDRDNGTLGLYRGYHDRRLPAPAGEPLDADPASVDGCCEEVFALQPGDMVLFHSLVPHRSGANTSLRQRRMLYFTYTHARHGADVYQRFVGLKARQHANTRSQREAL